MSAHAIAGVVVAAVGCLLVAELVADVLAAVLPWRRR